MNMLTAAQRRELRAKAHHLHPVVSVGHHGLTPAVMHEIDVNLLAHELIKVRVFADEREQREIVLERICTALDASPVQHIGKLLVLWRPAPDEPEQARQTPATRAPRARAGSKRRDSSGTEAKAKTMAKSTPQARRPRSPLARTTRGKTPRAPSSLTRTPSEQARRRRRSV